MRSDKDKAILLRKRGKSYKEISRELRIPKSTLASWFNHIRWSASIKRRLSIIARKNASKRMFDITQRLKRERGKMYEAKRAWAIEKFRQYKGQILFNSGLMVYWGEGDSKLENGQIRLTNTDPFMLRLFHLFLRRYLPVTSQKEKAYLILYPDLKEERCRNFWSRAIGLSSGKFTKGHFISGHHPTKRLSHGICTLIASSRADKEIILTWLSLAKKELVKMRV